NIVADLGNSLEEVKWTEEEIRQKMINLSGEAGLSRKEMNEFFQVLYQIFLGNTKGPRFAPFIAVLDKKWVIKKFKDLTTN
ncbi:MAG: hypothetical protein ACFE92_17975, partial [Promethearchaeota archaeon]